VRQTSIAGGLRARCALSGEREGRSRLACAQRGAYDLAIQLDIAEFSALLMGVVSSVALQRYSLATISDACMVGTVNRLFLVEEKPICVTLF
jgi:hypothetical protein